MRLGVSASANDASALPGSARYLELLRSQATAKSAEAEAATKRATEARQAATRRAAEAAPATRNVRAAEANLAKAEEALKAAERGLETAAPEKQQQAEEAKTKAAAKVTESQAQLETARAQAQAKTEAAERSAEEAKAAEAARDLALDAASAASLKTSPVSVFISRKTQRLYIRHAYQPAYEGPVTIRDADKPIGTYVFTARDYLNNGADMRWSVVSMYKAGDAAEPAPQQGQVRRKGEARSAEGAPADVAGAKAALDRIVIPPEALERITDVVLPGSSLIISDEGASIETGKDTDFVVLMSGEPQGGIKTRRREQPRYRNDFFGGGGGFFSFFD